MVIGFIGLGDVGSRFSSGITREGGAQTVGFDLKFGLKEFQEKENRCREYGVQLMPTMEAMVAKADIILAATSCADAIKTAEDAIPYLRQGQYYVDVNSAIPPIKRQLKEMIEATGAIFVDGGILDSPMNGWHKIPVALSGESAHVVADILNGYGMNMRNVGPDVGQASGLKILRSIFTKGLEALLLETFSSAWHYGVMDDVYGSIQEMLAREPINTMFERMVTTDVVHAERRAKEVGAVAEMLRLEHMDATMSQAAYEKLMWSARCGLKEHFEGKTPDDYKTVVAYLETLRSE